MKRLGTCTVVLAALMLSGCGQTDSTKTSAGESSSKGSKKPAEKSKKSPKPLPKTRLAGAYKPCMRELSAHVGEDTPTSGSKYMKMSPDGRTVTIAPPGPGGYDSSTAAAVAACMLKRTKAPRSVTTAWANESTRAGKRQESWGGVSVKWTSQGKRFRVVLTEKG